MRIALVLKDKGFEKDLGNYFKGFFVQLNRTNVRYYRNLNAQNKNFIVIERLLNSKVKLKIARFFAENKGEYQVSDIARILGVSKSRASECLKELEEIGFLTSKKVGRSKLYAISNSKIAETLKAAVTSDKSLLEEIEREVVKKLRKLKPISIVLFGSSIKGIKPESDIDIALISNKSVDSSFLASVTSELEEKYGIPISILSIEEKDLKERVKKGENFAINLLANYKLIYGKRLEDLVWQ